MISAGGMWLIWMAKTGDEPARWLVNKNTAALIYNAPQHSNNVYTTPRTVYKYLNTAITHKQYNTCTTLHSN